VSAAALIDLLRSRRSVRKFEPRPVPRSLLVEIVEAATWAPSSSNRQDWQFVIVTSAAVLEELAQTVRSRWQQVIACASESGLAEEVERYAGNFDWFGKAPAVVVVSCKRSDGFLERMVGAVASDVAGGKASAAMATQNLMLAAHARGLGSCPLTGPLLAGDDIKKRLGIEARRDIVCMVALGWAAESPAPPARREVAEVLRIVDGEDVGEPR